MICSYQQIEMVHKTEPIGLQRYWVGGIKVISFLLTFALWLSKLCWNTEHHHQITLNPWNLKWVRWFPKYVYVYIKRILFTASLLSGQDMGQTGVTMGPFSITALYVLLPGSVANLFVSSSSVHSLQQEIYIYIVKIFC